MTTQPTAAPALTEALLLLADLYATVKGECPSLIDDDRGGNSTLALRIEDLLAATQAPAVPDRLLQDEPGNDASKLSRALASKPDARQIVRENFPAPAVTPAEADRWALVPIEHDVHPAFNAMVLAVARALVDPGFSGLTKDDLAKVNCTNVVRQAVRAAVEHRQRFPQSYPAPPGAEQQAGKVT